MAHKHTTYEADLINYAIDGMDNISPDSVYGCDLHNELFNTDYFIIGYYEAEKWLKDNPGIFAAIETIKDYENDNFGQVSTDFSSSEKVVNMYAYIKGEEILSDCPTIQKKWNDKLTTKDLKRIKKELEALIN